MRQLPGEHAGRAVQRRDTCRCPDSRLRCATHCSRRPRLRPPQTSSSLRGSRRRRNRTSDVGVSSATAAPHLLGADHARAPRVARDALATFTSAVQAALGTDAAGAELSAYLVATYDALASPGASAATLRSVLGTTPTPQQVGALKTAHQDVQRARASLGLPANPESANGSAAARREPWRPALPIQSGPPLSPRSTILRLCDPTGTNTALAASSFATGLAVADNDSAAVSSAAFGAAFAPRSDAAAAPQLRAHNPEIDPDSDDEAEGLRRRTASLTWLEGLFCSMTGQSPPSSGGDDTVLLLIMQVRQRAC